MAPLNLTGIFIPALMTTLLRSKLEPIVETHPLDSYNYIIIGSGNGGSTVVNRLSENPEQKILLLEAGSKDNVSTQVPLLSTVLMRGGYDWNYDTVSQKEACFGMDDNVCTLISGKVVGGSSAFDILAYKRGSKEDFDNWEKLGNPGWSYDDVMPFFKKSEDYRVNGDCTESEYHGCGGELFIGPLPEGAEGEETEYFIKGAKEMGLEEIDYDGPKQVGVSRLHYTMRNGVRQSAATTFLRPVMKRPNLHISLDSFVRKIIIDPETKTATGVEFEKDGEVRQVSAKKEVILSAGIYSSPKILMLSGIGPKEELEKFSIPVIVDIPGVGQTLQEKISSHVVFTTGNVLPEERQNIVSVPVMQEWNKGTGLMASSSGIDAIAFMKSKYAENDSENSDLLILFQSFPLFEVTGDYLHRTFGYNEKKWKKYLAPYINLEGVILHPVILIPKSKGSVTIRSSDPHDQPLIDPNIYGEEIDKKVLIEGMQMAANFINTTYFKKKNYKIGYPIEEECSQYEDLQSDEYISCFLKFATLTKWCGCCTNKMGPKDDRMAVVDHRLRVRGVKGLRIVDASVIPQQYSGLPGAATIMIGEKAAFMITEDNQ